MATGKLYKRGDKWYIDIHTGRKVDGKYERIQRKARGRTKAEAQADLDERLFRIRNQSRDGRAVDNRFPLAEVCDGWCRHVRLRQNTPKLVNGYAVLVRRMVEFLGPEVVLVADITPRLAEEAVAAIAQAYSTNTAGKCLQKLKAALAYAVDQGLIASNPLAGVRKPKLVRKKFRRELARDEAAALLQTAPEPWRTIWHFALATGVRSGELLSLRPADMDLDRRQVRVVARAGFAPKTAAGSRTIPLGEAVTRAWRDFPAGDPVFFMVDGRPIRPERLLDRLRADLRHAMERVARERLSRGEALPPDVVYDR
ncbi:MAG: tyrosine-type recombinase/integrase [Planctomycetes bacterium]|nr:tyrosine-type recombinase/integrase [Planctomycetota bacterium]